MPCQVSFAQACKRMRLHSFTLHRAKTGRRARRARVEEAGELAVEALISRDELVGERQARHQPALLQPEDGAEAVVQHSMPRQRLLPQCAKRASIHAHDAELQQRYIAMDFVWQHVFYGCSTSCTRHLVVIAKALWGPRDSNSLMVAPRRTCQRRRCPRWRRTPPAAPRRSPSCGGAPQCKHHARQRVLANQSQQLGSCIWVCMQRPWDVATQSGRAWI